MTNIILPADLDPLRTDQSAYLATHLPLRDGNIVSLPDGLTYVFIIYVGRSGSGYLAHLLGSTGFFNVAEEPLNVDVAHDVCKRRKLESYSQYFATIAAQTARNGHFVFRALAGHLGLLAHHGILPRILPRSRFILLERLDRLAEAISWQIAVQTGRFNSLDAGTAREPTYSAADIRNYINYSIGEAAQARAFMAHNGLVPIHVAYETLTARPRQIGKMICEFLGQPDLVCDPAKVPLRRQATDLNRQWRARYLADMVTPEFAQPLAPGVFLLRRDGGNGS